MMQLIWNHAGWGQLCCCSACQASGNPPGFGLVRLPDGDIYDFTHTKYFIVCIYKKILVIITICCYISNRSLHLSPKQVFLFHNYLFAIT